MAKVRRFQVGALLIVAGATLIALNLWFLSTMMQWAGYPAFGQRHAGYAAPGIIGATMIVVGVMVLLGA
jgi:hypothetical protein